MLAIAAFLIAPIVFVLTSSNTLTQWGRNAAAELLAKEKLKYVTLYEGSTEEALTAVTKAGEKKVNLTGSEAKGFVNGKMIWFTSLTGGGNVFAKRAYEVLGATANGYEIAEIGGAAITVETEITAGKVELLKEEVAVARVATAFGAGAADASTDAERIIKVKTGKSVQFAAWSENSALGLGKIHAVERLTEKETYGAEGEYKLTSDKLEAPASLA